MILALAIVLTALVCLPVGFVVGTRSTMRAIPKMIAQADEEQLRLLASRANDERARLGVLR